MASSSLNSPPLGPSASTANHTPLMVSQPPKSPLHYPPGIIAPQLHHHTPSATPSRNPTPMSGRILSPELCDILSNQIAPSGTDEPAFAPILRCAQEELAAYKSCLVQGENDDNAITLVQSTPAEPPVKRRRKQLKQPKELVRATSSSQEDNSLCRALNRRVRIAYDSLRCHYHFEYITNPRVRQATKVNRSDLKAFTMLHNLGSQLMSYLQAEKRIVGPIPGVEIGDIFFHRAELSLLGVHNPIQAGIGYAPGVFVGNNEPIATSVVDSGIYEGDREVY